MHPAQVLIMRFGCSYFGSRIIPHVSEDMKYLADSGFDFVIHVFTEERRAFYGLDGLWGDAPKLDAVALGISESDRQ